MADKFQPRFAVSVTPIVELGQTEAHYAAHTVLHEDVRQTIGGGGIITQIADDDLAVDGTFDDGVSTPVTSDDEAITVGAGVELLYIKNTGKKVSDGSQGDNAYFCQVDIGGTPLGLLFPGDAIVMPRPQVSTWNITSNSTNHVYVEWLTCGAV